jgi:uncharacterized protein (DUF433 family)
MIQPNFRLIGRGVYSPHEASRLTGVPTARIRRWANGYQFKYRGQRKLSPPIIAAELQGEIGMLTLDFADLLEIRFLDAFLERGVSWKAIRIASERARDLLHTSHPFSSRRFVTDGHTVLANFASDMGDRVLLDLVRNQYEVEKLIADCLFGEIDFDEGDTPSRWWPLPGSRRIVIDPQRAFGAPIVDKEGIQTVVLASAVAAEESIEAVSAIYDVDPISVADAVSYEHSRS